MFWSPLGKPQILSLEHSQPQIIFDALKLGAGLAQLMLATKRGKKHTLSKVLSGWRSELATWREKDAVAAAVAAAGQMQEVCKQKEMLLGKLSAQKQQRQQLEEELQQTIQALELKLVLTAQVKRTASFLQQLCGHMIGV